MQPGLSNGVFAVVDPSKGFEEFSKHVDGTYRDSRYAGSSEDGIGITADLLDITNEEIKLMTDETRYNQTYLRADRTAALSAGTSAPDFYLHSTPDQSVRLSDFRGQPVVLAFYPADWSPVCGDQMALYNEMLPEFQELGATLVGISVDGVWCHAAFSKDRKLHFPLLADFEPKGEVARLYGVYRSGDGTSERALFVIDGNGIIQWSYVSPIDVNPGAEGILSALERMQNQKEAVK